MALGSLPSRTSRKLTFWPAKSRKRVDTGFWSRKDGTAGTRWDLADLGSVFWFPLTRSLDPLQQEADTLRKLFPAVAHNIPTKEGAYPKTYTLDNSQTKKVLGLEFQSLETMLKGSGEFLMKLAEKEGVDVAGKA